MPPKIMWLVFRDKIFWRHLDERFPSVSIWHPLFNIHHWSTRLLNIIIIFIIIIQDRHYLLQCVQSDYLQNYINYPSSNPINFHVIKLLNHHFACQQSHSSYNNIAVVSFWLWRKIAWSVLHLEKYSALSFRTNFWMKRIKRTEYWA